MARPFDPHRPEKRSGPERDRLVPGPRADLFRRLVAALLDGLVAAALNLAIPILGGLPGAAYLLFKDAIPYQITRNRIYANQSIGKRAAGLEVLVLSGADPVVGWGLSALRNWPLAIGTILTVAPLGGWFLGPVLSFLLGLLETVLIVFDPDGRRLGDRTAETQVVPARSRTPAA